MKKKFKIIATLFAVLFLIACIKENHSVRVKNNLAADVNSVKFGTATVGFVASGQTSGYVHIDTGTNLSCTVNKAAGGSITGTGKISGKGTHKWTIYISINGALTIQEDI